MFIISLLLGQVIRHWHQLCYLGLETRSRSILAFQDDDTEYSFPIQHKVSFCFYFKTFKLLGQPSTIITPSNEPVLYKNMDHYRKYWFTPISAGSSSRWHWATRISRSRRSLRWVRAELKVSLRLPIRDPWCPSWPGRHRCTAGTRRRTAGSLACPPRAREFQTRGGPGRSCRWTAAWLLSRRHRRWK